MTTKKRKHVRIPRDFTRLDIMHPVAAGIDIGSSSHFVAVSPHLCEESVREFGALTPDLVSLVGWFKGLGIQSVVMESTGIYWVPLYEMLEAEGIDVQLVNAHHVRSVPGRKSDVLDCQWLLKLHTFGLLRGSFRPTAEIVTLRTYLRQRDSLVVRSGVEVQHMHKALNLMNIKLSTVLSDITGKTGLNIIRAIVAGQRDPAVLASMRDGRCKACEQTLLDSLTGNYVPEHLFALRQALRLYDMLQALIEECDQESTKLLSELTESLPTPAPIPKAKKRGHKQPQVDYRTPATQLLNVDLTAIPGISEYTAITLMSEIGTDMSRWPTVKRFCAWLRLAPGTKITGGKVLSSRTLPTTSRAVELLRTAAVNAGRTRTAIGAFYRRMTLRLDSGRAVVATAHKIARIIYHLISTAQPFQEPGQDAYDAQQRERAVRRIQHQAAALGLALVPANKSGAAAGC
jgi:transposase